eukprot:CAMPEP_0179345546 /NCGR_PEP_ID=MMETSP0797-20121207/72100_1 /TAXON_ID=47934 /ORGANISM="Dinophysis acuminata, Strain DAEP01" /LENGTH=417 /DNA_ID=CAMNT_0021060039 /DNA_START=42 /DNA_END=1292 /DNA_ORIENTATION=+
MRFGKKLALRVTEDQSGAPYLSHKAMKEAINRSVRELRLYQTRLATTQQPWQSATDYFSPQGETAGRATFAELAKLETNVSVLDQQLFDLVDSDIDRILECIHVGEAQLAAEVTALQGAAMDAGLLLDESKLEFFERSLPFLQDDTRKALCGQLLELRLREGLVETAHQLEDISVRFNVVADMANQQAQYLEINVAGFRKLLKRHEKQIPPKFHSRPMLCLRFHKLITHTSRHLFMLVRQFRMIFVDARQRVLGAINAGPGGQSMPAKAASFCGDLTEPPEVKGLGPECEMVVSIQKQLRDPVNKHVMGLSATLGGAAAPMPDLYSKPATPLAWPQCPGAPVYMAPPQRGQGADVQQSAAVPAAHNSSTSSAAASSSGMFTGYLCAMGGAADSSKARTSSTASRATPTWPRPSRSGA